MLITDMRLNEQYSSLVFGYGKPYFSSSSVEYGMHQNSSLTIHLIPKWLPF